VFTVLSRERLASSRDKTIFGRVWFLSRLTDVGGWGELPSFDLQQAATLSAGLCTLPERQTAGLDEDPRCRAALPVALTVSPCLFAGELRCCGGHFGVS
jgi:hypothetical protein